MTEPVRLNFDVSDSKEEDLGSIREDAPLTNQEEVYSEDENVRTDHDND